MEMHSAQPRFATIAIEATVVIEMQPPLRSKLVNPNGDTNPQLMAIRSTGVIVTSEGVYLTDPQLARVFVPMHRVWQIDFGTVPPGSEGDGQ